MPSFDCTVHTPMGNIRLSESCSTGAPLVLIHGSGYSRKVFARQFDSPLADRHRLIALDLPGHGESQDAVAAEDYQLPQMARAVEMVLDARDVEQAVVFGWSLGGHIAIEMLASDQRVSGVMLTGAPPVAPGPLGMLRGFQATWDLLLATKEFFSRRDAERFLELCFHGAGNPAFLDDILRTDGRVRTGVSRSLMQAIGADQLATVVSAEVPIAMVNGENDSVARLGYIAGLAYGSLWRNVCHIIPNAGHAPFWDQADTFNRLLSQFAADCADRQRHLPLPLAKSA
ncbi:alpha/beta fold hydrolase [Devosia sp.]|uniref:alpha/beta fold hydrolase n=1 Tax=Devosia sp. TaxID=1871048 RepID=UPI003A8E93EB